MNASSINYFQTVDGSNLLQSFPEREALVTRGSDGRFMRIDDRAQWTSIVQANPDDVFMLYRSQEGLLSIQSWRYYDRPSDPRYRIGHRVNITPFSDGILLEEQVSVDDPVAIAFEQILRSKGSQIGDVIRSAITNNTIGIICNLGDYIIRRSPGGRLSLIEKRLEVDGSVVGYSLIPKGPSHEGFILLRPSQTAGITKVFEECFRRSILHSHSVALQGTSVLPSSEILQEFAVRPYFTDDGRLLPLHRLNPDQRRAIYAALHFGMSDLPPGEIRQSLFFSGLNGQSMYYMRPETNHAEIALFFVHPLAKLEGHLSHMATESTIFGLVFKEDGSGKVLAAKSPAMSSFCRSFGDKLRSMETDLNTFYDRSVQPGSYDSCLDLTVCENCVPLSQLDAIVSNRSSILKLITRETSETPILQLLTKETSATHFGLITACQEFINYSQLAPQLTALDVLNQQIELSSPRMRDQARWHGGSFLLYNPLSAEADSFYLVNVTKRTVPTDRYGEQEQVTIHSKKRSDISMHREHRSLRDFSLSIYPKVPGLFRIKLDTEDNGSSRFCDGPLFTSVREIEIDVSLNPCFFKCYAQNEEVFDFTFMPSESYIKVSHPKVSSKDLEQILAYAMRCFVRIKVLVGHPNTYRYDQLNRVLVGNDGSIEKLADKSLLTDQGPQNHPQVFTRYNQLTQDVDRIEQIKAQERLELKSGGS